MLRKLEWREKMFVDFKLDVVSAYLIKSKIDLNAHWTTFQLAVLEWQRRDEFLRCRVHHVENDYYFVLAPQDKLDSSVRDNVKYLKLQLKNKKSESQVWQSLVEFELCSSISFLEDLLWRLTVVELEPDISNTSLNNYILTLTMHHSISEGRGNMRSVLELLEVFESIYLNKSIDRNCVRHIPRSFQLLHKEKFKKDEFLFQNLSDHKMNAFLGSIIKEKEQEEIKQSLEFDPDDSIYDREGQLVMSVGQLVEKISSNPSRLRIWTLENSRYDKLVARCKKNGVKMTACLNLIISMSLKFMLEKLTTDHQSEFYKTITYIGMISNRDRFQELASSSSQYSSLGVFTSNYEHKFEEQVEFEKRVDFYKSRFWSICRQETSQMREHMDRDELRFGDYRTWKQDEYFMHFVTSNIGVMPSSLTQEKLVVVKQRVMHCKTSPQYLFMSGSCSVDDSLTMTILYSTRSLNLHRVNFIIECMDKIVDDIISIDF